MKYKIVADSSSNIMDLKGVDYSNVPLKILTSEQEYEDTPSLDVEKMVNDLYSYKGKSGTSCPNMNDWLDAFGDADIVLGTAITSQLSGSYASAVLAQREYCKEHPSAHVLIIDSLSTGPEMQLLLEKMRELVLKQESFDKIELELLHYFKHTHLLFSLESVKNLANNGRVNSAISKIVGVLGIRIVGKASTHGTLQTLHKCRGEQQAIKAIYREMKLAGYAGGKVRIAHCFNENAARQLSDLIRQDYPSGDIEILPCTGLCSFYAEKGGFLVGYEG